MTPEETQFLASSHVCDHCTHLSAFHHDGCLVPGCQCRDDDGVAPFDYAEYQRVAALTIAAAKVRSVEQAVDQ